MTATINKRRHGSLTIANDAPPEPLDWQISDPVYHQFSRRNISCKRHGRFFYFVSARDGPERAMRRLLALFIFLLGFGVGKFVPIADAERWFLALLPPRIE